MSSSISSSDVRAWLKLSNLSVFIEECPIVKEISLSLGKSETLVLMGPNGSGKSTVLMTLVGAQNSLLRTSSFKFTLSEDEGEADILKASPEERADLLTIVPQFPEFQRGLIVRKYLTFSRFNFLNKGFGENEGLLDEIIKGLGLQSLLDKRMDYLSGGELKRVAIAAALYQETPLILFDEPFQALDPKVKNSLADFLREWQKKKNCSYIITSHDFFWSYQLADKALLLKRGEVLKFGNKEDVLNAENLKETYQTEFSWVDVNGRDGFFMPLSSNHTSNHGGDSL